MKRTTYIMLAVFLGGFVMAGIFCMILLSNPRGRDRNKIYNIGGPAVTLSISEPFSRIVFDDTSDDGDYHIKVGFAVEMSDSVSAPCLRTTYEWQKLLTTAVAGDTLNVAFNLDNLVDSLRMAEDDSHPYLSSEEFWGITVIIPRGMTLRGVDGRQRLVMLKNFNGGSVEVQTNRCALSVRNCTLDSIIVPKLGVPKLSVDSSTVNYVRIPLGEDDLKVDCKDASGLIKRMEVRGVNKVKAKNRGDLNLADANISTLVWSPAPTDSVRTLDLRIKDGMEIICNNQ
ncbi:MAG: hypothetical protein HDS17_02110 [Bacteroides sp.]|nr:hypothetical protein [Bacteroides sp.]